jgi:hypothetical protein
VYLPFDDNPLVKFDGSRLRVSFRHMGQSASRSSFPLTPTRCLVSESSRRSARFAHWGVVPEYGRNVMDGLKLSMRLDFSGFTIQS